MFDHFRSDGFGRAIPRGRGHREEFRQKVDRGIPALGRRFQIGEIEQGVRGKLAAAVGIRKPSERLRRVVGATAVFFTWSPANSPDARIESIPAALESIGTAVPIPN